MKNENVNVLDPREQRKLAVAKLKLAASLPRLGGRRPQTIQPDAVSEVEKVQDNRYQTSDIDTPPFESIEPQVETDAQLQEPSTEDTEVNAVPPPSTRSVSSAKHDTNVLTHVLRSPISIHRLSSPPPPPPPPSLPPPPLPPLPPLEDIERNRLLRQSHSTIRRQATVRSLTDDVYLPLTPAATPPPLREIPHCNPIATGDEHFFVARTLKRKQRLNVLTPRVPKETDAEATNGKDRPAATSNSPRTPPMPLLLTPPPTPSPLTQHHPDILPNIWTGFRSTKHFPSTSAIPKRMKSSPLLTLERKSTEKDRPAPARWRGIIVEEEDDEDDEEEVLYPTGTSHLRLRYGHGREVSWIAPPDLEIRLPDDDDINQDKDNESSIDDRAPSSTPVSYLQQDADLSSPRAPSISRHSVVIESEIPSDTTSFQTPPSLPPVAILSTSLAHTSDGPVSSRSLLVPFRLSVVASPAQEDQTPLNTNFVDLDGRIADIDASKRSNGDTTSINTWEKITSFISPRSRSRSRSDGFGSREVRDRTDSSIGHECRASLDIGRTDKRDGSTRVARQSKIMHLSSASASVPSLIPSSMSPVPPASGLDYHQYQSSKLFPFPGLKKLEEERRLKGRIGGSSSTLDVSILGSRVEGDQVPMSAKSSNILPGVEHRIGHQTSDTTMRYQHLDSFATVSLPSRRDDSNISSTGSSSSKLPFVQRRLNTKMSKFSSSSSRPGDGASNTASLSYHEMIADHEVLPINETGTLFGMGYTETIPVLSTDVSEDEAIVDALLDASREPGPWHILDATTNELAKKVATVLSKSEIYEQLSDLPVIQAQSTLDFLQDLLDIRGLPLSYKRTFLKTSLKLSRVYDCVPRCLTIGGFNRTGTHPFARGHFGDLWKGEVGGTEVAIKQGRIFTGENNVKKVLRKMTREAIIWGQCDHPNVLPFYGIYCDPGPSSYCLVSPFMTNGPLRQYLSNVDNPDRHSLALDITRGMNYLHKLFLVHGDLKGDNILITDDHRAVIADFGISFVMGITFFGTSSSSRKGGTVKWQPPEVLNGSPNSLSADVYSLACVYFEVFDGSMPWSDLNDGAVIMNVSVRKKHPPRPKHLAKTDLWWELMVRCWAYEPSDRPTLQYLIVAVQAPGPRFFPGVLRFDEHAVLMSQKYFHCTLCTIMTDTPKSSDYPIEPVLTASEERLVLLPIRYPEAYDFYKKAQASVWSAEEMNLASDRVQWETSLTEEERAMFRHVLAFFATADSIVGENLVERFMCEVQVPEFRLFYGFQVMIENVHWEVYSLLIDTFIRDAQERSLLFHAFAGIPAVKRKAAWAIKWIKSERSFATRIAAFAAVEGIFFSGSFATIFWLKKRGLMPGFTFSNELIARDEALHTQFACYVFSRLRNRPKEEELRAIIIEASEVEQLFWQDALKSPILGMNASGMIEYIKFVTDRLLVDLGSNRVYHSTNPFDFIEMISLEGKTNFFEKRVSEYSKAYVGRTGDQEHVLYVPFPYRCSVFSSR